MLISCLHLVSFLCFCFFERRGFADDDNRKWDAAKGNSKIKNTHLKYLQNKTFCCVFGLILFVLITFHFFLKIFCFLLLVDPIDEVAPTEETYHGKGAWGKNTKS